MEQVDLAALPYCCARMLHGTDIIVLQAIDTFNIQSFQA